MFLGVTNASHSSYIAPYYSLTKTETLGDKLIQLTNALATKVHAWSGNYEFFDWKVDKVKSPAFGKRWE